MRIRHAIWLSLLAASVVWAGVADAHALLVRSLPEANAELAQPPASIEMWFSEPLEAGFSRARLITTSGAEASTGAVIVDPSDPTHMTLPLGQLEPGLYTVAWQTLSQADGHEFYGSFPITVLNLDGTRPTGEPATASAASRGDLPSPGEAISRWLWLLGGMLLLGAPLFQSVVVPASRKPDRRDTNLTQDTAHDLTLKAIWIAALAITVGHGLQVVLQALRLGGFDQLPELLLGTRTGVLVLGRQAMTFTGLLVVLTLSQPWPLSGRERPAFFVIALCDALVVAPLFVIVATRDEGALAGAALLAMALGMALSVWAPGNDETAAERRTWQALIVLAGALLLGVSIGSHAGAVPGVIWAVLGDYVHLIAAAAWVGGLLLLPVLLWRMHRASDQKRADPQPLLLLVRRFSYLASFSVFVLAVTGLFNSLVELPDLPSLWETAYGRVLLVKLGLIALSLGVAFLNNRIVHGKIAHRKDASRLQRLNRQVAVEAGVTLVLTLSVAVLVQTPAPRSLAPVTSVQSALPFNTIANADDLYIHVQVVPNQVGNNRFWLHLYHNDGSPIGEVQLVQLRFDYQDAQLGQASADLEPLGQDTFAVEGAYLSQAGLWDLAVYARRRGMDDALTQLSLDVPVSQVEVASSTPWQNPVLTLPPILLVALSLAALGAIPVLWRGPLEETWPQLYSIFRRGAVLLLIVGLVMSIAWLFGVGAESPRGNPISASIASLEQGKALYEENCLPCHGPSGKGDGPVGMTLNPRPANLQVHVVPGVHTDEQLFEWITNGFPDSVMPAFGEVLAEEERWHTINYLRAFAPQ